jgi:cobalt-zinc-cadmium efflux system protein
MSSGHGHGHGAAWALTAGGRFRRPLLIVFLLTISFVAVEFVVGIMSGSLALVSDAGHMLSDAGGLGMSLAAITLATSGATAAHRTYGWYRLEILASLANTVLLFAVAIYVAYEAIQRFGTDHEVAAMPMIVVAVIGLVINLVCFRLLQAGAKESLNLRAPTWRWSPTPSGRSACSSAPASSPRRRGTGWTR